MWLCVRNSVCMCVSVSVHTHHVLTVVYRRPRPISAAFNLFDGADFASNFICLTPMAAAAAAAAGGVRCRSSTAHSPPACSSSGMPHHQWCITCQSTAAQQLHCCVPHLCFPRLARDKELAVDPPPRAPPHPRCLGRQRPFFCAAFCGAGSAIVTVLWFGPHQDQLGFLRHTCAADRPSEWCDAF